MPPKGWRKFPQPGYINTVLKNAHLPKKASKLRHSLLPSTSTDSSPNKGNSNDSISPVRASSGAANSRGHRSPAKISHMANSSSPSGVRRSGPDGTPLLPASTPADICAFCQGPATSNQSNKYEEMVSCWECGSSGHPTCLDWADMTIVKKVGEYCWQCQDCKRCGVCDEKGEEDAEEDTNMLLCDRCDRGWHRSCLTPALTSIPRGKWTCPTCHIAAKLLTSFAPASQKRITILPPTRPSPFPQRQSSTTSTNRNGKSKWVDTYDDNEFVDDRRSRKNEWETEFDEDGDAIPSSKKKDKGKGRASDYGVSASGGPLKLTFRLGGNEYGDETPRKKLKVKKVEEKEWLKVRVIEDDGEDEGVVIEEEEELPYGGVLVGHEAEVGDRKPGKEDRKKWEKSRDAAEAKALQDLIRATTATSPDEGGTSTCAPSTPAPLESSISQSNLELDLNTLNTTLNSTFRPSRDRTSISIDTPAPVLQQAFLSSSWIGTPIGSTPTPTTTQNGKGLALANIPIANIKAIRFGEFEIGTWYQAPFPEEYSRVADGKLWICEFCLKYMKGEFQAGRHRLKCKTRHPPGDEIYRDWKVSVFEVDGRKNKIYCQNLCLLAKMFLDHKTLYYDVEPFLFYVMTTAEATGAKFVGYFSKEKRSPTNNVSCIMTLPVRQRKGWGNLLIDFSYLLSKKEGRLGTPERPLSDLGLLSYRNYWTLILFQYFLVAPDINSLTIEEISAKTAMTHDDIYFILKERNMITDTAAPVITSTPALTASPDIKSTTGRGGSTSWTTRKRNNKIATATVAGSSSRQPHEEDAHSVDSPIIPSNYKIIIDRSIIEAHVDKWAKKEYLQLKPDKLQWSPFLVTRGYGLSTEVGSTAVDSESSPNAIGGLANGFVETTNAMGAYLGLVSTETASAILNTNAQAGTSSQRYVEGDGDSNVAVTNHLQDVIPHVNGNSTPAETPALEEKEDKEEADEDEDEDIEMLNVPASDPPIEMDDEEDEDYENNTRRNTFQQRNQFNHSIKRRRSVSEDSDTIYSSSSRPTLRSRTSLPSTRSLPTPPPPLRRTTRGSQVELLTPGLGDRKRNKPRGSSSTLTRAQTLSTSSPPAVVAMATSSPRFRPSASKANRRKFNALPSEVEVNVQGDDDEVQERRSDVGEEGEEEEEETIIFKGVGSASTTSSGVREEEEQEVEMELGTDRLNVAAAGIVNS